MTTGTQITMEQQMVAVNDYFRILNYWHADVILPQSIIGEPDAMLDVNHNHGARSLSVRYKDPKGGRNAVVFVEVSTPRVDDNRIVADVEAHFHLHIGGGFVILHKRILWDLTWDLMDTYDEDARLEYRGRHLRWLMWDAACVLSACDMWG